MDNREMAVKGKKHRRKEIMAKIFHKVSDALKEYAKPSSERKKTRKIRKPARLFSKSPAKNKK